MRFLRHLLILIATSSVLFAADDASAETMTVGVQASMGSARINRGNPELDFPDYSLPQTDFGAGLMGNILLSPVEGLKIGPFFDYKASAYDQTDATQFVVSVPAVGVTTRVDLLPIVIQVSIGYSFGTASVETTVSENTTSEDFDLIGVQAQLWLAYEVEVSQWFSFDLGLFYTYDGMNFKDDEQPDRDLIKGPAANTLTYRTFGVGAQANFDVF